MQTERKRREVYSNRYVIWNLIASYLLHLIAVLPTRFRLPTLFLCHSYERTDLPMYMCIYPYVTLSILACSLLSIQYTQYTCKRSQKVGEAHRKGRFPTHTRTHPALPLVAQATKVAGIAGDHLPVTSLVLSSNKERQ